MAELSPLPPNNEDAESAVIGSLMIDPTAISLIASILKPQDFYIVRNAWIYDAIMTLGDKADLLTVSDVLAKRGVLAECGGESYLAIATSFVPTALNVVAYAALVKRAAVSRRLIQACSVIAADAWKVNEMSAAELLDRAQSAILKASDNTDVRTRMTLSQSLDEFYSELSEMMASGIVPGIPTGISDVDYMVGGWKPTRMTVVGGETGGGKTTFLLNTGLHAAKKGHRTLVMSLEMPESDLNRALVSNDASVDMSPQVILRMSPDQQREFNNKVLDSMTRIRALPLHLIYMPGASPTDLIYEAKRISAQYGHVELAIFDYLQIGSVSSGTRFGSREQEVSAIALELKLAAGKLDAHVMTASQLNEQGQTRESRATTHHADTVIYLEHNDEFTPTDTVALTANFWKNRQGKTGAKSLVFHKAFQRIAGASKEGLN